MGLSPGLAFATSRRRRRRARCRLAGPRLAGSPRS